MRDDLLRGLEENWSTLPVDEYGWPLAAAHIRLAYGAGYSAGLQQRVDAEPPAVLEGGGALDHPRDRAGTDPARRNEAVLDEPGS